MKRKKARRPKDGDQHPILPVDYVRVGQRDDGIWTREIRENASSPWRVARLYPTCEAASRPATFHVAKKRPKLVAIIPDQARGGLVKIYAPGKK